MSLSFLRSFDGPLTSELVQRPGSFGLGKVPSRLSPDSVVHSVCGFCSTGCSLKVHMRDGQAINVTANPGYPVNLGMACPKGWEALSPLAAEDRATSPLIREQGKLVATDWEQAMQLFTLKFRAIQDQHGADSVAWIGTGQMPTEELAFLGALAKFGLGFVHGDGNTRQCMATAVVAYKECFGFDAPPYTYADFEESDTIVLIGSNLCIAHPIMWQRVLRNRNNAKIIVVDPRRTETASAAHEHLQLRPKADLSFFYAVAHELIGKGWVDHEYIAAHTTGFGEYAAHVADYSPDQVAGACGLSAEVIRAFAKTLHEGKAVSLWWTMGINQGHESTRTAQAIIALALMTGNMGRPGTGANSITGQCNAMGSRLFSNTTNLLGGHDFTRLEHREKIAATLRIPVGRIPDRPSWAYDQILDKIDDGTIKGLWIIATNTAHSWIGKGRVAETLRKLDFLVVQDMYASTETAQLADLVLPAAGWGEKDGTFINSERRVGLMRKVSRAPGQALSDFRIFRLISQYAGVAGLFSEWTSPEAVFEILKRCSKDQPCDFTGITGYEMLARSGGVQWPLAAMPGGDEVPEQERRLFADGRFFTADQKARFICEAARPVPEEVDHDYPLVLLTGRGTSAQWHTNTRTGKSEILRKLHPAEPTVELHPADGGSLRAGDWVRISSRRGVASARAVLSTAVPPGVIYLTMHDGGTNELTLPSFDPYSRQPSYKHCAVRISAAVGPG
jgi:anaerobic selenocysteine-containing dehydrogenase